VLKKNTARTIKSREVRLMRKRGDFGFRFQILSSRFKVQGSKLFKALIIIKTFGDLACNVLLHPAPAFR
jgi:hypothetical protein